jgi:hypothetical protein
MFLLLITKEKKIMLSDSKEESFQYLTFSLESIGNEFF